MALSITDILAASYPAVMKSKPENQWAESAVLRIMEKQGFVKREDLGATIEVTLDYLINPGAEFLASDITPTSQSKTSVLGAASYDIAELSVPMVWTKKDEVRNPSQNAKVKYVKSLIENGSASHDQLVERSLFASSATQGMLSLPLLMSEDGTGTVGGIVSGTDTMWKSQFDDYGDATALLASLATVDNACKKGSGGSAPTLIVTSATAHGVLEGKLVANQRFGDANEANAGFKVLKHRGADVVFSNEYTSDSYFFLNPKAVQIIVSKGNFRSREETTPIPGYHAFESKIYSAMQLVTGNRSRLGVSFT